MNLLATFNKTNQLPRLEVAVVGYGYWGQKLAAALKKLGQKVWIVDTSKINLGQGLTQIHWQKVLASKTISAVVIATPEITHAKLVKAAVAADKTVLVEKPATANSAAWLEIVNLAKQKKLPVVVDYTFLQSQALQVWMELEAKYRQQLGQLIKLTSVRKSSLDQAKIQAKKLPIWWDVVVHDIYLVKNVWQKNLINWRVASSQPTVSAEISADFGKVNFEAKYGWSETPARSWVANYEFGKLVWERLDGQEVLSLYVANKLVEVKKIADKDPSPLDQVVLNWLSLVAMPKFKLAAWKKYWRSVAEDIQAISQIDAVYESARSQAEKQNSN